MRRLLLVVLLAVPLLEIFVLVKVGQAIGGLNTVLLIVLMAMIGLVTIRLQGIATVFRVRSALARGELPGPALLEGLWFLIAGVLLLFPGFVTDAIGLMLFMPSVRRVIGRLLVGAVLVRTSRSPGPGQDQGGQRTIEGEFTRRDD